MKNIDIRDFMKSPFHQKTYLSMVNAVMGCSGPAPGFVSSLVPRMSLIRKRSDGEQRD